MDQGNEKQLLLQIGSMAMEIQLPRDIPQMLLLSYIVSELLHGV